MSGKLLEGLLVNPSSVRLCAIYISNFTSEKRHPKTPKAYQIYYRLLHSFKHTKERQIWQQEQQKSLIRLPKDARGLRQHFRSDKLSRGLECRHCRQTDTISLVGLLFKGKKQYFSLVFNSSRYFHQFKRFSHLTNCHTIDSALLILLFPFSESKKELSFFFPLFRRFNRAKHGEE